MQRAGQFQPGLLIGRIGIDAGLQVVQRTCAFGLLCQLQLGAGGLDGVRPGDAGGTWVRVAAAAA